MKTKPIFIFKTAAYNEHLRLYTPYNHHTKGRSNNGNFEIRLGGFVFSKAIITLIYVIRANITTAPNIELIL